MEAKLGVLIVHGMGSQPENFADGIIEKLEDKISDYGLNDNDICWEPVYWAPILSRREAQLWRDISTKNDLHWVDLRKFVINAIGDAIAYQIIPGETNSTYYKIHDIVYESIVNLKAKLGNNDKPIIVIAHSIGSVIMSDYIWDRQKKRDPGRYGYTSFERMETLAGFITFGSPIPLYTLAYDPVESIKFPPDTLPAHLREKAKWLNFFDVDDVLGWPLKTLSKSYDSCVSEDNEINVGGILTSWNPQCHSKYWKNDDFIEPVAQYISDILKVCS